MKLQKVFVVLGISVCLIAAEMQATFGIEETGQEDELGTADEVMSEEPAEAVQGMAEYSEPVQPVQPVQEPVQPVQEPAAPVQEVQPVEEPAAQAQEPVQPVEQPATSAQEPVQPAEGSSQPATEPAQPGKTLIVTTETPTGEPAETTQPQQPETPVTGTAQPTETPAQPTEQPADTTQPTGQPVQPTEPGMIDPAVPADKDDLNSGTGAAGDDPSIITPGEGDISTGGDSADGAEGPGGEGNTGTEENPGGADDPGEEVPKDEPGTGTEENPGGAENPGEETPKDEPDTGIEENPGGTDGSDDYTWVEDNWTDEDVGMEDIAGEENEKDQKKQGKKETGIAKNKVERGSMFTSFSPSSEFIDDREKVKYNVEVPVSGLPGFITQEMVIGALKCQDETGYPASVTIAQIIQESGFGKYGPDGDKGQGLSYLAYQYNNLFGIKGLGSAGSVAMHTGEQRQDGSRYNITAGFRVYNTYTECIEDRRSLLERVYKDLTFGVKDANTFAVRIGQRWATSLSYGQNLIQQMNRYDLYRLDAMTLEEFSGMIGIFANPCPGARLTSDFGYRTAPTAGASTYHKGIDMGTGAYNIPTYAAQAGTVTYAGPGGAAGNLITIDHGNGLVTKYMHHDKVYVKAGDRVEKGQQIGLSGSTGNSTGNHLHFQVEKDGVAIDPLPYLDIQ